MSTGTPKVNIKYVLIIGAMKCGTSSLYRYASRHPKICQCRIKEPEYFSKNQRHGVDIDEYEKLWSFEKSEYEYRIEASTGYTKFPEEKGVPRRIYEEGIKPKFVYIVRDPVERIKSDHNYLKSHPEMEEKSSMTNEEYINRSKYYLQLSKYLEYFNSRDRYLIIDFENLREEPSSVLRRLYRFLELPPHDGVEYNVYNETPQVSSVEQWFRRPVLYRVRDLVPRALRPSLRQFLNSVFPDSQDTLSQSEKEELRARLQDDMEKFRDTFGFPVGKWGF